MGNKVKPIIVIIILGLIVGGYYFYLSNKVESHEKAETVTEVQEVLLRDLEKNYPPTPKEVVKYYSDISKCLYNEEYSEEQLIQMADKLLAIYDDELVSNNPRDAYIESLKKDIDVFKENSYIITTYTPSASTDVEEYTKAGRECAQLYCTYTIRTKDAKYSNNLQRFILRRDVETKHWKILGFDIPVEQ